MLHNEFTRKMILLVLLLCIVLGIFFLQQNAIVSKSEPQPTPTPIMAASGNIIISSPYSNNPVGPRFTVQGKARVPENIVSIRVTSNVLGKSYYQGQTVAQPTETGDFGDFSTQITLNTDDFSLRPNDKLTLEVYYLSPRDRSESDIVTIPLLFSPELP